MIYTGLNNTGEVEAIYGHLNGVKSEVSEVYGSIDYNDPIFYSRKTLTGTSPLTFKALGQPLKDYHIFGETVQDGTPSPDYPVDVQGVGERTENLLDLNREYSSSFTLDDTKWMIGAVSTKNVGNTYADVVVYFDKIVVTSKSAGYGASFLVKAKPNTDYYISYRCSITDESKDRIAIGSRDASGNSSKYVGVFKTSAIYTTSETAKYINICFRCHPSFGEAEFSEIIVCESDSQKQYEPYGYKIPITIENVTTPIYIGSDPLYRIGDYADEIDFGNQRIIRRIKKVIINGTESMTVVGPYGGGKYKLRYRGITNSGICSGKEKDTHFRTTTKNMDSLLDGEMSFIGISSRYVDFCKDTTMRSLQNWRDYFAEQYSAGTPVIILYVLTTPTTESVTIPTLTTITGDNALSIGTTIQPSAVSINGNIKPTGYGQLLDVNDVDIQDSTGEPVYIQG